MLRRSITTTLLLALLAFVLAACGGASKEEYEQGMRPVAKDISDASKEVAQLKPTATPKQRADTIRRQGTLLGAAADKADDLSPPEDAEKAHEEFISALRAYSKILDELADASLSKSTVDQQTKLLGQAGKEVQRLQKASDQLNGAGYTFKAKAD